MSSTLKKTIKLSYFAILREQRGVDAETVYTGATTVQELYDELNSKYNFKISAQSLKVAINDSVTLWQTELKEGDHVVFIPPVSGG